jgi:hypothetical protein
MVGIFICDVFLSPALGYGMNHLPKDATKTSAKLMVYTH